MIRFGNPCFAIFTELNPNLSQLSNLPSLLAQPFSTKDASLTLTSYHPKVGNFWSSGLKLWLLFITARTYVVMYVSSLRVLTYNCALCAWLPSNAQPEKRTYAILPYQWECLGLRIQSSMVILLSTCHLRRLIFFSPTLLSLNMLKH
jgi:hypothetical protein